MAFPTSFVEPTGATTRDEAKTGDIERGAFGSSLNRAAVVATPRVCLIALGESWEI